MRGLVKDVVVGLVGIVGIAAIVWLLLSTVFGYTLVVFRTGSMAPAMPTGAAAIAVPVEAADIVVGDVVTVETPQFSLPVTHRVIAIAQVPGDDDSRLLTLQGDANDTPDPQPYLVTDALRITASAPHVGAWMATWRTPPVMAASTLAIAGVVVWGLWPARDTPPTQPKVRRHART